MAAGRKRWAWALVVIPLLVLFVSFGAGLWQPTNENLAPDFTLQDINGEEFSLSDFRGKAVLLNFMATWCPTCRSEMPALGQAWAKYHDSVVFISIDIDPLRDSVEILRSFVQTYHYATWIWAMDTANVAGAYKVDFIPKTVIIDKDGVISFVHTGSIGEQTLNGQIEQLLG